MTVPLTLDEIERLSISAGTTDQGLRETVLDLGVDRTVALLIDEVVFRADVASVEHVTRIQLDIVDGSDRFSYTCVVEPGKPISVADGADAQAAQLIEYRLGDLVRELFGPADVRRAGRRRTEPRFEAAYRGDEDSPTLEHVLACHQGTQAVLSGIDNVHPDLNALAVRYLSDKWGGLHWFTPHYAHHLGYLRDRPVRVLEIGVGGFDSPEEGGGSLKMWRRFFPRGLVYGLDIFDKSAFDQPRVKTLVGDQNDPEYLRSLVRAHGPFDIIIDDGSHLNEHIRTSFDTLFPLLQSGGMYVIEDLWTTYVPGFGGDAGKVGGPKTSIGLLKSLVDGINHEEHSGETAKRPSEIESGVVGVHIYHNIAFIEKGINAEGGIPAFVPRVTFD